jgi:tRNA A37 threonylcarbamoyladenosine synthetase subunit TsaC/SUA5/YrdC
MLLTGVPIYKILHLGRAIHYEKNTLYCIGQKIQYKYNVYAIQKRQYMPNTNTRIVFVARLEQVDIGSDNHTVI